MILWKNVRIWFRLSYKHKNDSSREMEAILYGPNNIYFSKEDFIEIHRRLVTRFNKEI